MAHTPTLRGQSPLDAAGPAAPGSGTVSRARKNRADKDSKSSAASSEGWATAGSSAPLRPRRSPRLIALGLLLACLGGLGAALLWQQFSHSRTVIVVARAMPRGHVVEASDLTTTSMGTAPGVATVPASELPVLIGKSALVDLAAGSVLTPNTVGSFIVPREDAQLGIRLEVGRAPVTTLTPGTKVQLVPVPGSGADAVPPGEPVEAVVVTSPQQTAAGDAVVLDVAVAPAEATRVAQLAARNQLSVVRAVQG